MPKGVPNIRACRLLFTDNKPFLLLEHVYHKILSNLSDSVQMQRPQHFYWIQPVKPPVHTQLSPCFSMPRNSPQPYQPV